MIKSNRHVSRRSPLRRYFSREKDLSSIILSEKQFSETILCAIKSEEFVNRFDSMVTRRYYHQSPLRIFSSTADKW